MPPAMPTAARWPAPCRRIGVLLLPGFGLAGLAGIVETLRAARVLTDGPGWEAVLLSLDGQAVPAAGGVWVAASALSQAPELALALVLAEDPPAPTEPGLGPVSRWLRQLAAAGVALGGVGAGAAWLASAGVLAGHRATVHWPHIATLAEQHPAVVVSQQLYEIDRQRLSCAGQDASRDLMVAWLGQTLGEQRMRELAQALGLERPRASDERQRVPTLARLGGGSAKLAEAIALMEANLGEPLATEDIAGLVGVSRRQLERLFKQHLNDLPARWYLGLRLTRAQRLLRESPQSVLQIGLACGFASGPHFSNAYRAHFGHTPRDERSVRAQAWRAAGAPPGPASDGRVAAASLPHTAPETDLQP